MSDNPSLSEAKYVERSVLRLMLSKPLLMERVLYEMFERFHVQNRLKPNVNGHYYVAFVYGKSKWHTKLQLKQTESNSLDHFCPPNIEKLPQHLVKAWAASVGRKVP